MLFEGKKLVDKKLYRYNNNECQCLRQHLVELEFTDKYSHKGGTDNESHCCHPEESEEAPNLMVCDFECKVAVEYKIISDSQYRAYDV